MKKKFFFTGKEKIAFLLFVLCCAGYPFVKNNEGGYYQTNIFHAGQEEKQTFFSPAQECKKMIENGKKDALSKKYANMKNIGVFLQDLYTWNTIEEVKIYEAKNGFFLSLFAGENDVLHPYFGFFDTKNNEAFWGVQSSGKIQSAAETKNNFVQMVVKNTGKYPWIVHSKWQNKAIDEAVEIISQQKEIFPGKEAIFLFKKSKNFLLHNADIGFDVILEK